MPRRQFFPLVFPLVLFFAFLSLGRPGLGQQFAREWDALLTQQYPAAGPGASVLVAKEGHVLYRRAFGQADLERHVAMQPEHRFRLGSLTKQFTACAILKLAVEGKLSVHDELTRYLADYPTQGHSLTIEQVLTHTAGIPDYTHRPTFTPQFQRQDLTPRQLVTLIAAEPLDFVPGHAFRLQQLRLRATRLPHRGCVRQVLRALPPGYLFHAAGHDSYWL